MLPCFGNRCVFGFGDETTFDVRAGASQFLASLTVEFDVGDPAEVMNYPVQYSPHQINAGKHGYGHTGWLYLPMEEILKHAREGQLNKALLDFCHTDFMMGPFDLSLLAAEVFGRFYSEDAAFWLGRDLPIGSNNAWKSLAVQIEPFITLFEMGIANVESLRVEQTIIDHEGQISTVWELTFVGLYVNSQPIRWKTTRLWKNGMVVAEHIHEFDALRTERSLPATIQPEYCTIRFNMKKSNNGQTEELYPERGA